jgi:hypothetical protein
LLDVAFEHGGREEVTGVEEGSAVGEGVLGVGDGDERVLAGVLEILNFIDGN